MPTTTELTERFISGNHSIKECLKKGLINYSSLSRLIKDNIDKKTSNEAILIACRRYKDKIKNEKLKEEVERLFKQCNLEIKNNIVTFTLEKSIFPDSLIEIEKTIKKNRDLFYAIEGTKTITVISQAQYKALIRDRFKKFIIRSKDSLSLITITSKGIGSTPGAVALISSIFFENGINIDEFISCYDDTLIVIKTADVEKIMRFLKF